MEEAGVQAVGGGKECVNRSVKFPAWVVGRETGLAFGRGNMQAGEDWFLMCLGLPRWHRGYKAS